MYGGGYGYGQMPAYGSVGGGYDPYGGGYGGGGYDPYGGGGYSGGGMNYYDMGVDDPEAFAGAYGGLENPAYGYGYGSGGYMGSAPTPRSVGTPLPDGGLGSPSAFQLENPLHAAASTGAGATGAGTGTGTGAADAGGIREGKAAAPAAGKVDHLGMYKALPQTLGAVPPTTPAAVRYAEKEAAREAGSGGGAGAAAAGKGARRGPWKPPSMELAKQFQDQHHPRKWVPEPAPGSLRPFGLCGTRAGRFWCVCCGCLDPFREGVVSDLAMYGPGVATYFKMVKTLSWLFFAMTVAVAPNLLLNSYGAGKTAAADSGINLFGTTMGNLGDSANVTVLNIPMSRCATTTPNGTHVYEACTMSKTTGGVVIATCDLLSVVVLLLGFIWARYWQAADAASSERRGVTVEKYSVMVTHLPRHCNEEGVRAHFARVLPGHAIADVIVAEDETEHVRLFMQRGKLVKQLEQVEEAIWQHTTLMQEERATRWRLQRDALTKRIRAINDLTKRLKRSRGVLAAFVTFDSVVGKAAAQELYSDTWVRRMAQRPAERYTDRDSKQYRLALTPAPAPSVILWENLGVPKCVRLSVRVITLSFSILLLAISSAFIFWASIQTKKFEEATNPRDCPSFVPESLAAVNASMATCYCAHLPTTQAFKESVCSDWLQTSGYAVVVRNLSSLITVFVNLAARTIMRALTGIERHQSVDKMQLSLAQRLFAVQFVNTAILTLVLHTAIPLVPSSGVTYDDFSPEWYSGVGVGIIVTMFLNIFSPHLVLCAGCTHRACRLRYCAQRSARSQRDLNMSLLGPEFDLSSRWAAVMNTVASTMVYSTGLPVLIPVACIQLAVTFWVDKYMFLRYHRTPPRYSIALGATMFELLPLAVIAHLLFGVWMLTNPSIFSVSYVGMGEVSTTSTLHLPYGNRLQQTTAAPLGVVVALVAGVTVLRVTFSVLRGTTVKLFSLLTCGRVTCKGCRADPKAVAARTTTMTFSDALANRKVVGIPSYSMLMNPRFAHAFAISSAMAAKYVPLCVFRIPLWMRLVHHSPHIHHPLQGAPRV